MTNADPEIAAFLNALGRPKRRVRPRLAPALAEAEHQMIGGIATWRLGAGPAALLVHGWEDDNSLWGPLIEALAEIGRAVVAIDLPGHGFSEGERCGVLTAGAAVAQVVRGCGPIDAAVGHSFGCPVLAHAVELEGLRFDKMALIAGAVRQREQIARIVARYDLPEAAAEAAIAQMEAETRKPIAWFDLARAARGMTAAALIVHSFDDDACPVEGAEEVAAAWPGAELALTDGLGHRLIAQDAGVAARIAEFLGPG